MNDKRRHLNINHFKSALLEENNQQPSTQPQRPLSHVGNLTITNRRHRKLFPKYEINLLRENPST